MPFADMPPGGDAAPAIAVERITMLGWLRTRRAAKVARAALVDADAQDLIARFAGDAYYVARDRARDESEGAAVDANRPARHWTAVKARVAALTGKEVGLDTATRYLQD